MTEQERQLLLKDLCARLPYGVKVLFQVADNLPDIRVFSGKDYDYLRTYHFIDEFTRCIFKPYLRPMSSMTEEEYKEYRSLKWQVKSADLIFDSKVENLIDWLNEHHFDYRGLIEKGLAIAVTEENNPY